MWKLDLKKYERASNQVTVVEEDFYPTYRVFPLCDEEIAPADEHGYCVEIIVDIDFGFIDLWN